MPDASDTEAHRPEAITYTI